MGVLHTLFHLDQSLHESILQAVPEPGTYSASADIASVMTSYPRRIRGGKLYVNCMMAMAAIKPEIV